MKFFTSGASKRPNEVLEGKIFEQEQAHLVLVKGIGFSSLCEHHLLPFFGRAHIAYLPDGKGIGPDALPRLLDVCARRLQLQERLTEQVASAVCDAIRPRGVAVRLEASHFCMMMRGVEKHASQATTSAFLGEFARDLSRRQEFFAALGEAPEGRRAGGTSLPDRAGAVTVRPKGLTRHESPPDGASARATPGLTPGSVASRLL